MKLFCMCADAAKHGQSRIPSALRNRNYRLLLAAEIFSYAGPSMETVIVGWWVLQVTGSAVALGVAFAWSRASRWLGPFFGVVADRYNKRNLLIVLELSKVGLYFLMGFLGLSGLVQLWHVIAIYALTNLAATFRPSVQTPLVHDATGDEGVTGGISLLSFLQADTGAFAAPLAGFLYYEVGIGGSYAVFGVLVILCIIILLRVNVQLSGPEENARSEPPLRSLVEGLKYVWKDKPILAVLTITSLWNLLIYPYTALLPIMAQDVLHIDAVGLGFLTSAVALGQILSSFSIASLGDFSRKGILTALSSSMIGFLLLAFSLSASYSLSLGLLFAMGLAQATQMTVTQVLLLVHVPKAMRGRVMGVRQSIGGGGMIMFGSLMAGAMGGAIGAPLTLSILGASFGLSVVAIALLQPKLRKI